MPNNKISNIFVLQLENRSFDSMLGFSNLSGRDAETGKPTAVYGLTGKESNAYQGQSYTVAPGGYRAMPVDPGHEFENVVDQLCGPNTAFKSKAPYPPIDNSGYVDSYVKYGKAKSNYGDIMRGYTTDQLPVLSALAHNFALCDQWFSSLPGPTWPNRYFTQAASSNGLDHSPDPGTILWWLEHGFDFPKGSMFQALDRLGPFGWRVFSGDKAVTTIARSIPPVSSSDIGTIDDFCTRIQYPHYPWLYTFLEPSYGDAIGGTYRGGSSQHPVDDVVPGEALIKKVYEAIRRSPLWERSLLIVTWDEHGGFYDHYAPPAAIPPGDTQPAQGHNQWGFLFDRYGVRVPAVIVSPWIEAGTIDHRVYDHASIPKTIESLAGIGPLTERDKNARDMLPLLSRSTPRTDAPLVLPNPNSFREEHPPMESVPPDPDAPIPVSMMGFVWLAIMCDVELSPPGGKPAIQAHLKERLSRLTTVKEAGEYIAYVQHTQQLALNLAQQRKAAAALAETIAAAQGEIDQLTAPGASRTLTR